MVASSIAAPLTALLVPALRSKLAAARSLVHKRIRQFAPPRHRTVAVTELSAAAARESGVLVPSRLLVDSRVDPTTPGAASVTLRIAAARAPAGYHVLERAWVRRDWNGAVVGRRFLTPWADPREQDRNAEDGSLEWRGDRARVALDRFSDHHEAGVFLGGLWSFVWGHWIVDVLPRLLLEERLPAHLRGLPLLGPGRLLRSGPHREALATLTDPDRVVELPRHAAARVDRLVLLDGGRDLVAAGGTDTRPMTGFRTRLLAELRERVRREVGAPTHPEPGRRLLLLRSPNTSDEPTRRIDDTALRALAHAEGLEPIALETLSFAEQVRTVASAEAIVGVSGSAWATALFANPGTRGLIVRTEAFRDAWIPATTTLGGVATRVLEVAPDPAREAGASIDPRTLAAAWQRTVGAATRTSAPDRVLVA